MSEEVKQLFARRIRYYSEILEMKQQDIAKKLSSNSSTVNDWFTGKKMPRMDKIQALADLFGVEISDLVDKDTHLISPDQRYLLDKIDNATEDQLAQLRKLAEIVLEEDS